MEKNAYDNFFCELIKEKNPSVLYFLSEFDEAITVADDIIDRKVRPEGALYLLHKLHNAAKAAGECPGLYDVVAPLYDILLTGEGYDLQFVPGSQTVEQEIETWELRGYRASIGFACLCYADESFKISDSGMWIMDCQRVGLIRNDCEDILSGRFEDFIQCRRNYVALTCFDKDIYYNWHVKKDKLRERAFEVHNGTDIEEPVDKRLMPLYEKFKEVKDA